VFKGKEISDETSYEDSVDENSKITSLRKIIGELPEKYAEIITLIDLQEMKYEEAAEILELSKSAVRSRISRAREKLSEIILKNKRLFI